jgi:hypothetical protein
MGNDQVLLASRMHVLWRWRLMGSTRKEAHAYIRAV